VESNDQALARAIGKVVRRSRDGLGWSQADLAEQVDTSVEFVSMLERGARMPSVPTLVRLAKTLRVSVDELVGWERGTRTEHEALVALVQAVPPDVLPVVARMLRGVAEPTDSYGERVVKRRAPKTTRR
jgi:transcriptional regulator with XRE-family HTH domain